MVIVNKKFYIEPLDTNNNRLSSNSTTRNNTTDSLIKPDDDDEEEVVGEYIIKDNKAKPKVNSVSSSLYLPSKFIDLSLYLYSPTASKLKQPLINERPALTTSTSSSTNNSSDTKSNLIKKLYTSSPNTSVETNNTTANTKSSASSLLFNSSIVSSLTQSSQTSKSILSSSSNASSLLLSLSSSSNSSNLTNSSSPPSITSSLIEQEPSLAQSSTLSPENYNNFDYYTMMMMLSSNNSNSNSMEGSTLQQTNTANDEHEELLAEMELIERLPTQERLKHAKQRRAWQLKKWAEYEKTFSPPTEPKSTRKKRNVNFNYQKPSRSIKFQDHIVLLDAIIRKDYDETEILLESGVTPNSANEDGLTAIHQCCIDNSVDLLKLLIKNGADVNVCDNDLWTPLHAAATCANLEICKILIENKADLLAVNTDGNMPYDICDDEVCLEYIESEMAARGVTQQTIDQKRSESEVKMLEDLKQIYYKQLNNSGNHNPVVNDSKNSFFIYFNNTKTIDGRLDFNAKDNSGATLMHIASANGYNTILEFLLNECKSLAESGNTRIIAPSLQVKDNDGWTPLHVATFWGHQKAIEILLEHGGNVDARTNNDETVLELCDDPDVREFIIQKSKEIETQQLQKQAAARAAAAMQQMKQLQSVNNGNSTNSNINNNTIDKSSSINNINGSTSNNNINNSTRSLKRTSTGVSRSSSVRRSSFRDKEKAARKLDTSFKDVLYASENQISENSNEKPNSETHLSANGNAYNNEKYNSINGTPKLPPNLPLVINHLKDDIDSNKNKLLNSNSNLPPTSLNTNTTSSQKMTTVVKIINNNVNTNTTDSGYSTSPSKSTHQPANELNKKGAAAASPLLPPYSAQNPNTKLQSFVDDHNNNQLKLSTNSNGLNANNVNNSTLTTVTQIARIHSNGTSTQYQQHQQQVNKNTNPNTNNNLTASSNYSMTSSLVSTTSLPVVTSSLYNTSNLSQSNQMQAQINNSSINSNNTVSTTSIAIIDVTPNKNNKQQQQPLGHKEDTAYKTSTNQPSAINNKLIVMNDDVKYKFISNETIGAKASINNEFSDINMDSSSSKFNSKCSKCYKCCMM